MQSSENHQLAIQRLVDRERIESSGLFDGAFYLAANPDVAASGRDPLDHYLDQGAREERDPHSLFDTRHYLSQEPALVKGANPLLHFLVEGAVQGRRPNWLFDPDFYLRKNPDVAAANVNPLSHFLRHGAREGRHPHPLFDPRYYESRYLDVAAAGDNPLNHFLTVGAAKGYQPHPLFDVEFYTSQRPRETWVSANPLQDFLEAGAALGLSPHPLFDAGFFRSRYKIPKAMDALSYYLDYGAETQPNPFFDGEMYLKAHPDVASREINPLVHFVLWGAHEGRWPQRPSLSQSAPIFDANWRAFRPRNGWGSSRSPQQGNRTVNGGKKMLDFSKFATERDRIRTREAMVSEQFAMVPASTVPDFLIIGAPRAGTTWLATMLGEHPGAYVNPFKELKFFSKMLLCLDVDWYLSQFEPAKGRIKGEATPSYASLPLSRIRLIRQMNPALKIIYIVREPGERLISDCQHALPGLEEMREEEIVSYAFSDGPAVASDYGANLTRWLSVFPSEQIQILFYDDLVRDPRSFVEAAMSFLGLDGCIAHDGALNTRLNSSRADSTAARLVHRLYSALFAARVQQFNRLLDACYPTSYKPNWLDPAHFSSREKFVKALQLPDGNCLFFVEGRYVYGPQDAIERCRTLENLRALAEQYSGIGIGNFWSEAVAKALILNGFDEHRLLALVHGDGAGDDMYLVRGDQFGWNILYYRGLFFCVHISTGTIDLRTMPPEDWERRYQVGQIRDFDTLQEANDFTVLSERPLVLPASAS